MEDVGRLLREDRERRGESVAAQARRLGLARGTLAALERGADVRLSTLGALLVAFPALAPPQVLGARGRVPPASRALSRALARASDVLVERLELVVDARAGGCHERRTVLRSRALASPASRAGLLRALLPGRAVVAAALARQLATSPSATHEAAGVRHDVQLRGDSMTHVARSERAEALPQVEEATASAALVSGVALTVTLPARQLVIAVTGLPAGCRLDARAWLAPLNVAGPTLDDTHPAGGLRTRHSGREARVVIDWPVAGTAAGACIVPAADAPRRRAPRSVLRAARVRAGLTTRTLGARVRLSAMAISKIERGADMRMTTARTLLDELPALSPWSLLPATDALSPQAAWHHAVDLFGVVSEEEWKLVTIDADGNASLRIGTRGLTRLRGSGVLRVGLGIDPPGVKASGARLSEVHAGVRSRSMRIGSTTTPEGERHQHIEIPEDVAARPVSFERLLSNASVYTMTRTRAFAGAAPADEAVHEGASFGPLLPCERLVLEVSWPRGWQPRGVRRHCWPAWLPPDPAHPDIPGAPPSSLDVDERRRRITLRARRPLIGSKLALSWELP